MAEVRQCFGRGAYGVTHKIYNRHLLEGPTKQGKSAILVSSLSARFPSGDFKNGNLYGAENAAGRVTVGASRDSYTRVTPAPGAVIDILEKGNVAEYYSYRGPKEYSLSNKTHVQIIDRNQHRCRSNVKFKRTFRTPSPYCIWRLNWGHGQFVFARDYSGNGGRSEPLYKTKTGYYEILDVLPTATHAQIKTAYYKQSFIYHPDRNAGSEEATTRFSEISEAYTVLGNKALRKKYDRGLLSPSDLIAKARPSASDSTGSSAKQQTASRRSAVGADIRGGIFDFDKFYKSHYSDQLQRQRDIRVRKEEMLRLKQETIGEKKLGKMMEMCVGAMVGIAMVILFTLK